MPVLDLYLPDDVPLAADADLGRLVAGVVDATTGADGDVGDTAVVYVHRLPVYGVVSASVEGIRCVRLQVQLPVSGVAHADLASRLEESVCGYLRVVRSDCPTRVVVSVLPAVGSSAVTWPHAGTVGLAARSAS